MDKYQTKSQPTTCPFFAISPSQVFHRGGGGGQACSSYITVATKPAPFPFPNRPRGPGAELQQLTATSDARLWRAAVRYKEQGRRDF